MRWASIFLALTLGAPACVVEDKAVAPSDGGGTDGTVDGGECTPCPDERPVCVDGVECVECTADEPDYCTERDQICDPGQTRCVDCLTDETCTLPTASRCDSDSGQCAPCEIDIECNDVEGLRPTNNLCDAGECIECTPETEADNCPGGFSCDPSTGRCTDTRVGSLEVCEACVADSECGNEGAPSEEYRCVPMFYPDEGMRFPNGDTGFCLKTTESGCTQPYSITLSQRPSLSGPPLDDYCGINESLATCPAVRALESNARCDQGMDEECPQPSGLCRRVGNLENRCTYLCSGEAQCDDPPNPGSTCGASGSGGDDYCGG